MHLGMQRQRDNAHMDIPSRLRPCIGNWHIQVVSRLRGGFRSELFACTTISGDEVVVKLAVTPEEARTEAAALGAWAGTGATVHLIDADFQHSALLMDRIRPAAHLPSDDDPVAVEVAADLLRKLHEVPPGSFPFPSLEQTYAQMERRSREDADYEQRASGDPTQGVAGLQRLDAARSAAKRLCATTKRPVLLHGDFLDKNLLWDATGYVAIDPIPCIGDPCSDVGFFAAGHPPATAILPRAVAIAERMGLDPYRARQWAMIWTVLQACQAWRRDQSDLEACLSSDASELLH
jgi:streptomycin 6-kinase